MNLNTYTYLLAYVPSIRLQNNHALFLFVCSQCFVRSSYSVSEVGSKPSEKGWGGVT